MIPYIDSVKYNIFPGRIKIVISVRKGNYTSSFTHELLTHNFMLTNEYEILYQDGCSDDIYCIYILGDELILSRKDGYVELFRLDTPRLLWKYNEGL